MADWINEILEKDFDKSSEFVKFLPVINGVKYFLLWNGQKPRRDQAEFNGKLENYFISNNHMVKLGYQ